MFKEEIFEIAFGDNAINKDYSEQEVIDKIRYYSDISIDLLEACKHTLNQLKQLDVEGSKTMTMLQQAINKAEEM